MKQILIYTNPNKEFSEENKTLIKIQIDNAVELGWRVEDILLFTNFEYEYHDVKATIVPDIYCDTDYTGNKIPVIIYLIKNNLLEDTTYWYHDIDAYQNIHFSDKELEPEKDLALAKYGYKPEWNLGMFAFKLSALDIFEKLWEKMQRRGRTRNDEKGFNGLVEYGFIDKNRLTELDVSYNLTMRYLSRTYPDAIKPIRMLHFHPFHKDVLMKYNTIEMFMYGKNKLGIPIMSERLISLFQRYGIK